MTLQNSVSLAYLAFKDSARSYFLNKYNAEVSKSFVTTKSYTVYCSLKQNMYSVSQQLKYAVSLTTMTVL